MKFILNTATDTHFCASFDEQGELIKTQEWTNRRRDGEEVYEFLQAVETSKITFCGGVTGPGGFSSLRAGGGMLNALTFANKIPVHQVRADIWIKELLGTTDFLLNSFSDGVFYTEGEELVRIGVLEAVKKFKDKEMWVELLPVEKREKFTKQSKVPFANKEQILLKVLEMSQSKEQFEPDYEFPPV
ncbi:hypothetical protein K9M41_03755 [Candidatus Gracilibacteria bacterium]|nr:hypothetical protein [Candidatus Gracilibacteria bacterium]